MALVFLMGALVGASVVWGAMRQPRQKPASWKHIGDGPRGEHRFERVKFPEEASER